MTTVIDVGCSRYNGTLSVEHIVDDLHPARLLGFDPTGSGPYEWGREFLLGDTVVLLEQKAAWTHDGEVGFERAANGVGSRVSIDGERVPCVDIARVVFEAEGDVVLKLDCEGAEYTLLDHLLDQGLAHRLAWVWVEWHRPSTRDPARERLVRALPCEVVEWQL